MANILNTRIRLKYDTLSNWTTANPVLLAGEIAIATITSGATQEVNSVAAPQVLFKVGDGTNSFNSLPFASGKAADVYSWAKEATMTFASEATQSTSGDKTYVGNAVTGVEWDSTLNNNKGGLKFIKGTQFATKAELDAALAAFDGEIGSITDTDTRYDFTIPASGDNKGKLAITATKYVNGSAEGNGTTTYYDFITPDELSETLGSYYTKTEVDNIVKNYYTKGEVDELVQDVRDAIPTEVGVMSVEGSGAVTASGTKEVTVGLSLDNSGNVLLSQGESGLKATVDLSAYRLIADDQDTKYGIEYDAGTKTIKLTNDPSKSSISAADFVKDGMLQSVVVDNAANTLTFTWNTDSGVTTTVVKLSDIADIYTGSENSEIKVSVGNSNEISATLVNGGITEEKLHSDVTTKLNKVWEEVGVAKGLVDGLNIDQYQTKNLSTPVGQAQYKTVEEALAGHESRLVQDSQNLSAYTNGTIAMPKATADASGNDIVATYLNKTDAASTYVAKEGFVATDNNYTTAEKNKLESLENYNDSAIREDIAGLQAKKVVEYYDAEQPNDDHTPVFVIYCGNSTKVM